MPINRNAITCPGWLPLQYPRKWPARRSTAPTSVQRPFAPCAHGSVPWIVFRGSYMLRTRLVSGGVLVSALVAAGLLFGGEPPTGKGKGKGRIYWNKIGLCDEQR